MADDRDVPTYLAVCPSCKNGVGVIVDDGDDPKSVAKFCSDMVKAGMVLERGTVGAVRDGALKFHADDCPRNRRKVDAARQKEEESV